MCLMLFGGDQSEGPVVARLWRRLWLWVLGRRREEPTMELSEWDLDVWEIGEDDVDFIPATPSPSAATSRPASRPPPIPVAARAGDLPRAVRPASIAPPADSAWDDVLARARAALVSETDPQQVARTPAPAFDPLASRPRVGRNRGAAPGRRGRRRRTTSSVTLACLPADEAVPRPVDRESSSGVSSSGV